MVMPSKMVMDRQKGSRSVLAAGEANADAIGARLKEALAPHLRRGETMPDFALLVRLFCRALAEGTVRMVAADAAHQAELSDDEAPRAGRDETAAAVALALGAARDAVESIYGPATASKLGIPREVPRDPTTVLQLGRNVIAALPGVKLPKPVFSGASVDLKAVGQQLKVACDTLGDHLGDVAREEREAQLTQLAKNQSIEDNDHWFTSTARIISGLLYAIGLRDLSDRIRPSRRRPGTTAGGEDDTDTGGDTTTGTDGTGGNGGGGAGVP